MYSRCSNARVTSAHVGTEKESVERYAKRSTKTLRITPGKQSVGAHILTRQMTYCVSRSGKTYPDLSFNVDGQVGAVEPYCAARSCHQMQTEATERIYTEI